MVKRREMTTCFLYCSHCRGALADNNKNKKWLRLYYKYKYAQFRRFAYPPCIPLKLTCTATRPLPSSRHILQGENEKKEETTAAILERGIAYAFGLYDHSLTGVKLFQQDVRYWLSLFRYLGRKAFLTYDKEEIIHYYSQRPWIVAIRFASVGMPLLYWYGKVLLDRLRWSSTSSTDNDRLLSWRARELVQLVMKLGPTFIKVAQALSTRPDVVGPVWMKELEKLVDKVDPFPSDWARRLIAVEIQGTIWESRLVQVSTEPVASASLGQVYQGLCRGEDGTLERIALKVQRPGLIFDVPLDLYILRWLGALARRQFGLRSDLVGILDEYAQQVFEEMDYQHESENCVQFGALYGNYPGVRIPKVFFATRYLLALEWIDGEKPPWGSYSKSLLKTGIAFSLHQLLDVGLYHADPHAGNLLRTTRDNCLAYVDYGMVRYLDRDTRWHLIKAIIDFVNKDFDELIEEFIALEFLSASIQDKEGMIQALQRAFQEASSQENSNHSGRLSQLNFSRLAQNLGTVARSYPIRIPPKFALIIRCLTMLEGLALQNDPNFHIVEQAYPFIIQRLLSSEEKDNTAALPPQALGDILLNRRTGRIRWNRLWQMVEFASKEEESTKDPVKLPVWLPMDEKEQDGKQQRGVVVISRHVLDKIVHFLLSDRAAFLRDGLAEEMADILDDLQLVVGNSASVITMGWVPRPRQRPNRERLTRLWHWIQTATSSKKNRKALSSSMLKPMSIEEWLVMYLFQDILVSSSWWHLSLEAQRMCRILAGRWIEKNNQRLWDLLSDITKEKRSD